MGEKEEKIKNYLKGNNGKKLEELESGLVLFEGCKEGKIWEIHMDKSDLLCFNKNDNAIVVIEIKSGRATHHTFGQILYYLAGVENIKCANARLNEQNVKKVRGIVLANKIVEPLETLITKYKNCIPEIRLIECAWDGEGKLTYNKKM